MSIDYLVSYCYELELDQRTLSMIRHRSRALNVLRGLIQRKALHP